MSLSITGTISAQLDTLHFIPPFGTDLSANEIPGDVHIYLTTPSSVPVSYTITDAANTTILQTGTVVKGNPVRYDSYGLASGVAVSDTQVNTVLSSNVGFRIHSEEPIYVNLRIRSEDNAQAGSLTSKGLNAFGYIFRLGSIPNQQNNSNKATTFGVTATEDNTIVEIDMTGSGVTLQGTNAPSTDNIITVELDQGESYVMRAEANVDPDNLAGMIGTLVTSNRPIVVNTGSWCGEPTTSQGRDYGIDQIAGLSKVGTDYIFVRASGGDNRELPMMVAHYDDTEIFVNASATPIATINAGEYYTINGSNYVGDVMHVHSSKDVFAYQILAGNDVGNTAGMNFVPDISCQIEERIDAIPDVSQIGSNAFNGGATITTFAGSEIYINGSLETSTPQTITLYNGDQYDIYRLGNLTGDQEITSNTMAIVSFFGVSGVAGYGGYFSGFSRPQGVFLSPDPILADAVEGCQIGAFLIERVGDLTVPLDVDLSFSGTATYGTDYTIVDTNFNEPGSSFQFQTNQSSIPYLIIADQDSEIEGIETIEVTMGWAVCNDYFTANQALQIYDPEVSVTCPSDTIIGFNPGTCSGGDFTFGQPLVESNCYNYQINRIDGNGFSSGDSFPSGNTTITWEASLNAGNIVDQCSYTITVQDVTPPLVSCPANITDVTDNGMCTATVALGSASATDNCNAVVTNDAPAVFPVGTTIVTWTATDDAGNIDTCQQTVTITDGEAPVVTCPANITDVTDNGMCTATVNIGNASATDNCSVASITNNAPAVFPVGTTVVTWTATDDAGNTHTCDQTITITDGEAPVVTCPANITDVTDNGMCTATVNIGNASATDNCSVAS
ncbi:MAG: HYR domain-containing protein, partial [Flavobacteriales bacterium]|nr:HYR domain-containing protein [Flavobacteriales bacterium]